jgi:membrane protein
VKELIKKNALFLGMLLGIGFLMTVSLVLSAALASLGKFFGGFLPAPEFILHGIDFILSAGIIAVLLCHDVQVPAQYNGRMARRLDRRRSHFAALQCGKDRPRPLYGKSAVASSYGAAGSILVLLLWIYYSGLIFYFGAEFTKSYADRYGSRQRAKPVGQRAVPAARNFPATNYKE